MTDQSSAGGTGLAELEVVVVCYRSRHLVEDLVQDWPAELGVVVVDNSGDVDGISQLAQRHRWRYLDGGGQGFARAANLGAFSSDRPRVVFVNPDSRPTIADLLSLAAGLDADPQAVSHAPVTATDGDIEIGVGGWEPTIRRTAVHAFGLHLIWPRAGLFAKPELGEALTLDWTTGDCMVVRTDQFRAFGGFDETFYLYAEDVSFGRRARQAGLRTVLREDVVIAHVAETSGAPALEMLRVRGASFAHYLAMHNSPARAQTMRLLLAAGYLARVVQRRLLRQHDRARLFWAFVRGLMTGRADVGGVEVALARYVEVAHPRRVCDPGGTGAGAVLACRPWMAGFGRCAGRPGCEHGGDVGLGGTRMWPEFGGDLRDQDLGTGFGERVTDDRRWSDVTGRVWWVIGQDLDAMSEGQSLTAGRVLLRLLVHSRWRAVPCWRLAQASMAYRWARPFTLWLTDQILRMSGAELAPGSRVGPGVVLKHTTGLVVGSEVVAGARLTMHQNVTLGDRRPFGGQPTIGDDVVVGAGACVLGPISIGDRVVIGANAVVLADVPSDSLVVGVPGRVVARATTEPEVVLADQRGVV